MQKQQKQLARTPATMPVMPAASAHLQQQRRQQITISVPPDFKKDINLFRNFNYRRTLMFILQLELSEACMEHRHSHTGVGRTNGGDSGNSPSCTRDANANKWDKCSRAYKMHE